LSSSSNFEGENDASVRFIEFLFLQVKEALFGGRPGRKDLLYEAREDDGFMIFKDKNGS